MILAENATKIASAEEQGAGSSRAAKGRLFSEMRHSRGNGRLRTCSAVAALARDSIHAACSRAQSARGGEPPRLPGSGEDLAEIELQYLILLASAP